MTTALHRDARMAGTFYPAGQHELTSEVERYLASTGVQPVPESVAAIVVPHAGFVYSGQTAAHAYARVAGSRFRKAVLIGCSHHARFDGASIITSGAFDSPLGTFEVDEPLAGAIAGRTGNQPASPHIPEHALEVQLPFLAVATGRLRVVPILLGGPPSDWHIEFGHVLATLLHKDDLLVVTTDLSHYLSHEEAVTVDTHSLELLQSRDLPGILTAAQTGECNMCSAPAVITGLSFALARGATGRCLLDYRTSAEQSGDYGRVVGYAALSLEHPA